MGRSRRSLGPLRTETMKTPSLRALLAVSVAALVGTGSCGGEKADPTGSTAPREPATSPTDALDRLRALGYTGYAPDPATSQSGALVHDPERSWPGYNLALNYHLCSAELSGRDGTVLHSWHDEDGMQWNGALLLPGGDLIVVGSERVPGADSVLDRARRVMRIGWNGDLVWKREVLSHHSLSINPAGQLVVLALRYRREPALDPEVDVRDDVVTLFSLEGEKLEERSLHDVLGTPPGRFELQSLVYRTLSGRTFIDLFHTNTAEWMRDPRLAERDPLYALTNVLVTSRNQDAIAILDWSRKEVLWSWGQDEIRGPHDATVLADGTILLLDNGLGRGWSRLLEVDPTTDRIVWEYRATPPERFYSAWGGTAQRLPNGNTLVASTATGTAFEVTRDGDVVWEYFSPHLDPLGRRSTIISLERYEESYVDAILERVGEGGSGR